MRSHDPFSSPEKLIRRVYAYAAYRLGDGPDAEDATSEVFERALRYRASYDAERAQPATWLLGIARRVVADRGRQTTALMLPTGRGDPSEATALDTDLETSTLRRLELIDAIGQLSESDQELLALRYGADLTARQIAELLDKSPHAVETGLHRALGRLRDQFHGIHPPHDTGTDETAAPTSTGPTHRRPPP